MSLLKETIEKIEPIDKDFYNKILKDWDNIAHPMGSLGRLEELSARLIAITKDIEYNPNKKAWCVFSADNGIVLEGVSCQTQDQTTLIANQMIVGNTASGLLAKFHNIDLRVIDMGLIDNPREEVINRKISRGTRSFLREDAMSMDEAIRAIEIGIEMGDSLKSYDLLMAGELGIGNTTTSSAVLSAITGLSAEETVGKGAGINSKTLQRKREVVSEGLKRRNPDRNKPLDVLSKVGGYDICGMVGLYLSCAKNRIPVILDGFISMVSALVAIKISNYSKDYMLPSHYSNEQGTKILLKELDMEPYLNLKMRLGEGTGAPLMINLIENSLFLYRNMYRFNDSKVNEEYLKEYRNEL